MKVPPGYFHGQTLTTRSMAGFQLMETEYLPHTNVPKHSHENGCFFVMLDGALTESYGSRTVEWTSFCVGYNPPDEEHSNVIHDRGARFFIVDVSRDTLERARENSVKLDQAMMLRGESFERMGLQLYHEARRFDDVSPLAVEGLVLNMLAEAARFCYPDRRPPRWLLKATELLNDNFSQPLTIDSIAQLVGVHPVTLSSGFVKYNHRTIGQYVRQLRVSYACRELANSRTPLSEIALAAGFCDQSHFTRVFKEFTGVTPAKYRMDS